MRSNNITDLEYSSYCSIAGCDNSKVRTLTKSGLNARSIESENDMISKQSVRRSNGVNRAQTNEGSQCLQYRLSSINNC